VIVRLIKWGSLLGLSVLVAVSFYFLHLYRNIRDTAVRDEAQSADAIVVLGAAQYNGRPSPVLKARLDHALDLYVRRLAPRIMTTGGSGGDPVFTEAGVGRTYLMARGVPSEAIVVEAESESTVESTAMAVEIMSRMGLHSVIVVTDGYHVFRVKKMLEAHAFTVYGSPRRDQRRSALHDRWNYVKQAIGYLLWRAGVAV